ncbi:LCP family protein [Glutamicibacter sp.]|nr:LCP family protein [Glutamicibacter sp.]HJX77656.1 LCP family protein [Glutamicibacter sp.]
MLLMHLPPGNGRIEAIQIPRDTVLYRPACEDTGFGSYAGGYGMINSALNYGPACSVAAVEELTGVHLNHFIEVNFEGFISIVNALDGIKVCLNNSMQDSKANLNLSAGQQTLDGPDALALARTRHAIGDGSDIARLGNQQMVMSAIVQRAKSKEVLTRPDRLYAFLDAITSAMTVDPDLSTLADLAGLAARIQTVPTDQITFTTMPTEPAPENPNRVVPAPDAKLIFERISQDIPVNSEKNDHLSRKETAESAISGVNVLITNGTNVNGLASQYSELATSSGFTVSGITNSPTLQKQTRLLIPDTKGAKKVATELAKATKLDVKTTVYGGEGLQLVLGQDYADLQVPENKTITARSRQANQDLCG